MKNRMIYQMKNKVRNLTYFLLLIGGTALTQSCSYLDVVPDKIGTIDNSFTNRNEAEKYLNTCYSYIPGNDSPYNNVALMGADELWSYYPLTPYNDFGPWKIALGRQNVNDPLCNMWYVYYRGIRDCNIFLEKSRRFDSFHAEEMACRSEISESILSFLSVQNVRSYRDC